MKEFISHVDYLIQRHDCVIIPEFGGFVLSHEGASFAADGSVLPPSVSVGFNPELRYNDGLLAESYMNVYAITYDVACKRIDDAVKRLNTILGLKHPVQMGNLGKLELSENNRLSFTPNARLSLFYPDTFGLSKVNIRRLSDIMQDKVQTKKRTMYHRVLAGTGAAAAAILIFFIASTPITENENTQKSSLFTDLVSTVSISTPREEVYQTNEDASSNINNYPSEESENITNDIEQNSSSGALLAEVVKIAGSKKEDNRTTITSSNTPSEDVLTGDSSLDYFVVISGTNNNTDADRLLRKFKTEGLANVGAVHSKSRIRIYAESFATRAEAESYLASFKEEHPQFSDAWVYFQENR